MGLINFTAALVFVLVVLFFTEFVVFWLYKRFIEGVEQLPGQEHYMVSAMRKRVGRFIVVFFSVIIGYLVGICVGLLLDFGVDIPLQIIFR